MSEVTSKTSWRPAVQSNRVCIILSSVRLAFKIVMRLVKICHHQFATYTTGHPRAVGGVLSFLFHYHYFCFLFHIVQVRRGGDKNDVRAG